MHGEKRKAIRRLISLIFVAGMLTSFWAMSAAPADAESLSGTIIVSGAVSSSPHVTITDTFSGNNLNCVGLNGAKIVYYAPVYESRSTNGFSQTISNFQITADPAPTSVSGVQADDFGNHYKKYEWSLEGFAGPSKTITVTTAFDATCTGNPAPEAFIEPLPSSAPYGMYQYINPTGMVQSTNGEIVSKSAEIVSGASSEADAVDRIISFVRTSIPNQASGVPKDAVSSLHSSSGTCVNRANLALGLLRAANIPARYVNGIVSDYPSIKVPFVISGSDGYATFQWGKELHAWVEVYYPQKGVWVAYDPWLDKGFIDQRHVMTGIALDSNMNDKSTGGYLDTFNYENVNQGATGAIATALQFSGVSASGESTYTFRSLSSRPSGALMLGRDMVNMLTPTPVVTAMPTPTATATATPAANATVTPTPTATVTITPIPAVNATVTPTPGASASPNATASPVPGDTGTATGSSGTLTGDGKVYYITGMVLDEKTGARISDAAVLIDGTPVKIDSSGAFAVNVTSGNHTVSVTAPGYGNGSITVTVADKDVPVILNMLKAEPGKTSNTAGLPIPAPGFGLAAVLAGILIVALYRYGRA